MWQDRFLKLLIRQCRLGFHDWNYRLTVIYHADLEEEIDSEWCANCKIERVIRRSYFPRWEVKEKAKIRYEVKDE